MTITLVQGFEQVLPTTVAQAQVLPAELRDFFGFQLPVNTTDWFLDGTGAASDDAGPMIIDSDHRIDGQSLRLRRPDSGATYNPQFNGAYAVDLTKTLSDVNRVSMGFAVKYSKIPEVPIPLVQFRYDDGTSEGEKTSLWVSSSGKLMMSSVDFDLATTSIITPSAVAGASSAPGVINFGEWVYVEIDYNVGTTTPEVTVWINGVEVLNATTQDILKDSVSLISAVSIINPQNIYFPDDAYDMYVDDIYVRTGDTALGPQHIVLLEPTSSVQEEFVITGGEANSYLAVDGLFDKSTLTDYITNDDNDDQEIFGMENTPISVKTVTAVAVGVFCNVDDGSAIFTLQTIEGADVNGKNKSVASTTPVFRQGIFETAPDDTPWTSTHLDALQIGIEV